MMDWKDNSHHMYKMQSAWFVQILCFDQFLLISTVKLIMWETITRILSSDRQIVVQVQGQKMVLTCISKLYVCVSLRLIIKQHSRGKSLLELWVSTFLPDWQLPLIFIRFISNLLCMCSNSMASAHVIFI